MHKKIFKPFIRFIEWHLKLFNLQTLRLETAEKYNLQLDEHDTIEKIYIIWKWTGIFYSFSSYILFPIYLFLKYYVPTCPDVIFQFIGLHIFFFGSYLICNWLQRAIMDQNIREDKKFHEKY